MGSFYTISVTPQELAMILAALEDEVELAREAAEEGLDEADSAFYGMVVDMDQELLGRLTGIGSSIAGDLATAAAAASEAVDADDPTWDAFVRSCPSGGYMQLSAWAEANAEKGWWATRVVAQAPHGPVGAQLLIHRMHPGPWSRGYAPRGPIARGLDQAHISAFTDAVRRTAAGHRLSHVTIDPEVDVGHPVEGWLRSCGWRQTEGLQVNTTRIIDLRPSEPELWRAMRPKWRQYVNRARHLGIVVSERHEAGLAEFEPMYLETARRAGFTPTSSLRSVFRAFERRGEAHLLMAHFPGGRAAAGLLIVDDGRRATELHGASSAEGAAARANYLIKWQAISDARRRGALSYDMWGLASEGIAWFKEGFGGDEHSYVGTWELVTDRPGYTALGTMRRAREVIGVVRRRVGRPHAPALRGAGAARGIG